MTWPLLYAIDAIALLSFALLYYTMSYRQGYRIDIFQSMLLFSCVVPNMVMLPFAAAAPNVVVLGRDYPAVAAAVPAMFLVSLLGYVCIVAGAALWKLRLGLGIRKRTATALRFLPRCSMMLMSSPRVLIFQTLICLALEGCLLAFNYSQKGFNLDLRTLAFERPEIRPVVQATSFYAALIASHCMARYIERKERSLLLCNIALAVGLLLFGSRGGLINIYLGLITCGIIQMRRRVKLLPMITIGALALTFFFYLGSARSGEYSLVTVLSGLVFLLLYGNNFSDLRDFAWVYSAWDHNWWLGKTYLAALFPFVPRFLSNFRDTWGMGVVTASTVGFDPANHPGLRPGAFGESFFNFGLLGVVAVGFAMGIIVRRADLDVKQAFDSDHPSMMRAFAATSMVTLATTAAISLNSSTLYVTGVVYLFSWVCLQVERLLSRSPLAQAQTA